MPFEKKNNQLTLDKILFFCYYKKMPIIKSAKKSLRQNKRRRSNNLLHKNQVKRLIKEIRILALDQKPKEAKELLSKVYKELDKAAKTKAINKNTAKRRKSRLTKLVNKH